MNTTLSPEAVPSTNDRAPHGRFPKGNPGGPGNPFARQTAALRAYLIAHVTERDLQDILDILLLNAKGGHLPSIKLLFAYILGKPKPVVEPDTLDLQEMQMLQQTAQPPEALATACEQLPLAFQVRLTRYAQTENAAAAVQAAQDHAPVATTPPPSTPSTNGIDGTRAAPALSTDGSNGDSAAPEPARSPSPNDKNRHRPTFAGFDWLRELRRAAKAPGGRQQP